MFIATQLIGILVLNAYKTTPLPYGMQAPEVPKEDFSLNLQFLITIILAFAIAIFLVFFLTKVKSAIFIKIWFFVVITLAISITLNSLLFKLNFVYSSIIAVLIALPLSFFKIFKQNFLIHNLTELMVYPGIAAVFVPILNVWTIIILLIAISIYDIWAVWHSGFMQKMAKYQINNLKIFAGFFVPYMSKKQREQIRLLKQKYKNKNIPEKVIKNKKIKVSLAILGGGDVIFPIIAAGVFLKTFGLLPALSVTLFSSISLLVLFIFAKKGKFYPAMPFLTAGILTGMLIGWALIPLGFI